MNSPQCTIILIDLHEEQNCLGFSKLAFTSKLYKIQLDLVHVFWADSPEAGAEHTLPRGCSGVSLDGARDPTPAGTWGLPVLPPLLFVVPAPLEHVRQ